jgi:uncharacterized protein (UPF0332 family)
MSFPDQLLEQARHLAKREKTRPRQASLRRAVSTAYYALFHLLISEATKNWKRADQRHVLARAFDHGKMKNASEGSKVSKILNVNLPTNHDGELRRVADTFIQSQQERFTADYDNATQWTRTQVLSRIDAVADAFQGWKSIRDEPSAQAYLLSFLGKDR